MSDPRTLIFGTSYVEGQHSRYLFGLWCSLVTRLNPGVDIIVVDSASPDMPKLPEGVQLLQLGDNIGHLMKTGKDGWGRAFCAGLDHAITGGYRYAVHIECDVLLAKPVMPVIERMKQRTIPAACPIASPYSMIGTEIMFLDTLWIKVIGFQEQYNWETSPVVPYAETRVAEILGDELWCLPWKGYRNDLSWMTPRNLRTKFPAGLDWITHCQDIGVYREFLEMNGLG